MDVIMEILTQYRNILIIRASFVVVLIIGFLGDRRFKKKGFFGPKKINDISQNKKDENIVISNKVINTPEENKQVEMKSTMQATTNVINGVTLDNVPKNTYMDNSNLNQEQVIANNQTVEYNYSPEDSIKNIF